MLLPETNKLLRGTRVGTVYVCLPQCRYQFIWRFMPTYLGPLFPSFVLQRRATDRYACREQRYCANDRPKVCWHCLPLFECGSRLQMPSAAPRKHEKLRRRHARQPSNATLPDLFADEVTDHADAVGRSWHQSVPSLESDGSPLYVGDPRQVKRPNNPFTVALGQAPQIREISRHPDRRSARTRTTRFWRTASSPTGHVDGDPDPQAGAMSQRFGRRYK